ncbi:MAG: ABC transporter permease [Verrucomicrobia bacterium Tous-C9LFEB]|nr:MAG: ABC transporter permease [Verrucomicrobia bacterium Tous-C9LFEB]
MTSDQPHLLKLPCWRDPSFLACVGFVVVLVIAAIAGPSFTGYRYDEMGPQFSPPSWKHWCGTDFLGYDLLTRLLYGARISLLVGFVGAFVSLTIGVAYGAISGYIGGWVDNVLMRALDVLYSLPRIVFVIVLVAALEKPSNIWITKLGLHDIIPDARLLLLFIGLGLVEWLTMARIVRGQVLVLKELSFVQAAKALGQSHARILWQHLLPNMLGIILIYLTLTIPVVILEESFLSFLGLGVQAPAPSWGSILSESAQYINPLRIYWWLLVFPAGFMALTLLALNFIGDTLRDALDPRSQKK